MKTYEDQYIVLKGYKNEESKKAGFPTVTTPPIRNTEQDLRRAIKEYGLDDSANLKIVTTTTVRS